MTVRVELKWWVDYGPEIVLVSEFLEIPDGLSCEEQDKFVLDYMSKKSGIYYSDFEAEFFPKEPSRKTRLNFRLPSL